MCCTISIINRNYGTIDDSSNSNNVFAKTVFRAFTDQSYTSRLPHDRKLGILGPTLRVNIGDQLIVNFRNQGSRPYSIHPNRITYPKNQEGNTIANRQRLKFVL